MRRLRRAPRAPLAVAGVLATPLFFVSLMAFSLLLDEPSVEVTRRGAEVLADPARTTVAAIYLLSFGVSALVLLIGVLAVLLPARVAIVQRPIWLAVRRAFSSHSPRRMRSEGFLWAMRSIPSG